MAVKMATRKEARERYWKKLAGEPNILHADFPTAENHAISFLDMAMRSALGTGAQKPQVERVRVKDDRRRRVKKESA